MGSTYKRDDPEAWIPAPRSMDPRRLRADEREARRRMIDSLILELATVTASVVSGLRVGCEHLPGKGYGVFVSFTMMGKAYRLDYLERASLAEAISFLDGFTGGPPTGALANSPARQVGGAGFMGQPYVDSLRRLR